MFVIWSCIRIQSNICASKKDLSPHQVVFLLTISLLQFFFVRASVVAHVAFILSLYFPQLFVFRLLGRTASCYENEFISFISAGQYRYLCKQCSLIRINTVCHAVIVLTQTHICNNGCVQINRWKSPFRKLGDERVKDTVHQNAPTMFIPLVLAFFQSLT